MNRSAAAQATDDLHPASVPTGALPADSASSTLDEPAGKWGRPRPGKDSRSRSPERQAAFLASMEAAFARRCETQNPQLGLESVWARRARLEEQAERLVIACRRKGFSWADIGKMTGMTSQGAWLRWGDATREEGL
jgi:hypothetical protein